MVEALRNGERYDPFGMAHLFQDPEESESERPASQAVGEEVDLDGFVTLTELVESPERSLSPREIFLDGDWVLFRCEEKTGARYSSEI